MSKLTCESWVTLTPVLLHKVDAGGVVLTLAFHTVINVDLTAVTLKASRAVAAIHRERENN